MTLRQGNGIRLGSHLGLDASAFDTNIDPYFYPQFSIPPTAWHISACGGVAYRKHTVHRTTKTTKFV